MTWRADDRGQVFTMEGIVAALIIVLSIIFITSSVNLVSPPSQKAADTKLSIKAQDTLGILGTVDQPANYSSVLNRCLAAWTGHEGNSTNAISPDEGSTLLLDQTIGSLLRTTPNVWYNVQVTYWDEGTSALETKTLIYHGDAQNLTYNVVAGTKRVVLNERDVRGLGSSYWKDMQMPKALEIKLLMWSV